MAHLSSESRAQIVILRQTRKKYREILNVKIGTAATVVKNYNIKKSFKTSRKSGRPRCTTEMAERRIIRKIMKK